MANNSPKSTDTKNTKQLTQALVGMAVLVFVMTGWAWWHFVRSDPERTFYAAVENNLRTQGVSRSITQGSGSQKLEQVVRLNMGVQRAAHSSTTISQSGGGEEATVKTESISTIDADYERYTQLDTPQKNAEGEPLDYGHVLNIWGKTSLEGTPAIGKQYSESILGVVPVGNLSIEDRSKLMKQIVDEKVYQFDEAKVKRSIDDGRPVYEYDVTVAPEAYINMLKQFTKSLGMDQLDDVDPANYRNAQALTFKLRVDVWGRQFTGITYSSSDQTETLSGYGIYREVDIPEEAISAEELQIKLQQVQ